MFLVFPFTLCFLSEKSLESWITCWLVPVFPVFPSSSVSTMNLVHQPPAACVTLFQCHIEANWLLTSLIVLLCDCIGLSRRASWLVNSTSAPLLAYLRCKQHIVWSKGICLNKFVFFGAFQRRTSAGNRDVMYCDDVMYCNVSWCDSVMSCNIVMYCDVILWSIVLNCAMIVWCIVMNCDMIV